MEITHLGHSALLVEISGSRILLDPGVFSQVGEVEGVDAVFITHQHPDHLDVEALRGVLARSDGAQVYAEPQTAAALAEQDIAATPAAAGSAFSLGDVELTPVGEQHAVIHEYLDRIGNLGVVLRAPGEPSLFHPGDALDAEPGKIDHLCVPLNAPWCAVRETIAFVRRLQPRAIIPIHDALLVPAARSMYLTHVQQYGLDGGVDVIDLAGAGPTVVDG